MKLGHYESPAHRGTAIKQGDKQKKRCPVIAQPHGSDLGVASQSDASQGSDPRNTSASSAAPLGSGPDRASASDAQSAPDPNLSFCSSV